MLDRIAGGDWPVALLNVVLLMLWGALPILLIAYVRQSLMMQRIRPDFALRRSEASELDRALALYQDVCGRLAEIEAQGRGTKGILHLVFALQPGIGQIGDEECDDLKAHARHLRATIAKLRGLPLRRLRAWIADLSLQYTVGGALAIHVAAFVILVLTFYLADLRAAARALAGAERSTLVWYPFDASYFLSNGAGAAFGMLLAPAFYLLRRTSLAREYAMEFAVLKALAETPAEAVADPGPAGRIDDADVFCQSEPNAEDSCFAVLGVEQSATLEQVRAAYRMRIKQSHPDRLHDVSPSIKVFAEGETKRLNAAFQEALERLA
jgi:DnaJ domain